MLRTTVRSMPASVLFSTLILGLTACGPRVTDRNIDALNAQIDIRGVLSAIRVPTLVLHSVNDRAIDVGASRYLAGRIPGAKLVELRGADHIPTRSV